MTLQQQPSQPPLDCLPGRLTLLLRCCCAHPVPLCWLRLCTSEPWRPSRSRNTCGRSTGGLWRRTSASTRVRTRRANGPGGRRVGEQGGRWHARPRCERVRPPPTCLAFVCVTPTKPLPLPPTHTRPASFPPAVASAVYNRAVRNCPWVGQLWGRALRALERLGALEEHENVYERALKAGLQVGWGNPPWLGEPCCGRALLWRRAVRASKACATDTTTCDITAPWFLPCLCRPTKTTLKWRLPAWTACGGRARRRCPRCAPPSRPRRSCCRGTSPTPWTAPSGGL